MRIEADLLDPWKAQLVHLDGQLEEIVETFALSLRLGDIVTPDIAVKMRLASSYSVSLIPPPPRSYERQRRGSCLHSMSANKDGVGVRVLVHSRLQTTGQILLECRVLDNGNAEGVVVSQHTLPLTTGDALDLLNGADLEAGIGTLLALHQQGHQDGPLRVGVNTAASTMFKRRQEERSAGGRVQFQRTTDIVALLCGVLFGGPLEDEDVLRLHELLLDPGRRNEDMITVAN